MSPARGSRHPNRNRRSASTRSVTSRGYSQPMTVLSRGARARRGGRRPGWLLLTVLLVLAIAASSALVFTNRVELLKLAVILALWAAVVAAFVSVIYRRQSDADQAKVRDLKMVYDLQLDREISARREYELSVESHLRREIAAELRAQSADEVAALRAELAALRTNLEILFDTDLAHRAAIETERASSEWVRGSQPVRADRVVSSRITAVPDDDVTRTAESPIIDVPEEPLIPPPEPPAPKPEPRRRRRVREDEYRGSHRRPSEDSGWVPTAPPRHIPAPEPIVPEAPPAAVNIPPVSRPAPPVSRPIPMPPPAPAEPAAQSRPEPQPDWQPMNTWIPGPPPPATPAPAPPVPANGYGFEGATGLETPPPAAAPPPVMPERRGRHASGSDVPVEPAWSPPPPVEPEPERRGRHWVPSTAPPPVNAPPVNAPAATAPPEPTARHRGPDTDAPPEGQSAADLLARFRVETGGGGRRRRRED